MAEAVAADCILLISSPNSDPSWDLPAVGTLVAYGSAVCRGEGGGGEKEGKVLLLDAFCQDHCSNQATKGRSHTVPL